MERRTGKQVAAALMVVLSLTVMAAGCSQTPAVQSTDENENIVHTNESVTGGWRAESYLNGIVYQESAEVAGLQYQAYQLAKIRLDERIAERDAGKYDKPIAIISDIDNTLASDANYMAGVVLDDPTWDNTHWDGYYYALANTSNVAIPGAVEFCQYAASKGVEVFYITNRLHDQEDLTVAQLQRLGFPNADADHVQVCDPSGSSNKDQRRQNVLENYDVVLYMGDNIGDFTSAFAREMGAIARTEMASDPEYKDKWGVEWIVLPNATYGDYCGAVWKNDKTLDAAGRAAAVRELLEHYAYTNTELYETWYPDVKE